MYIIGFTKMILNVTSTSVIKFIVIAVCLVFMIFVIWKLYRDNMASVDSTTVYWPPEINKCPDYWTYKEDGKCHSYDASVDPIEPLTGTVTSEMLTNTCKSLNGQIPWEGVDNLC